MKECMRPHPLLHTVSGAGIGLLLAGLVPALGAGSSAVTLGAILLVGGVVGEFVFLKH